MDNLCFAALILIGAVQSDALNMVCQPNGDILIENPDESVYLSATAWNLDTAFPCTVYGNQAVNGTYPTFNVNGCSKNQEIVFTVSDRDASNTGDNVIGGSQETYIIECLELEEGGVQFIAELYLTVRNPDPTIDPGVISSMSPVDVSFTIRTSIWSNDYSTSVSTASIGTQLKWLITGPDEFDLLPLSCVAYGGTSVGGSDQKTLTLNGCTQDETLLSDFSSKSLPTSDDRSELVADLFTFKFVYYDYITLACTLRVCDDGSSSCAQSCSTDRRKRSIRAFTTTDIERLKALLRQRKQSYLPSKQELQSKDENLHKGYIVKYLRVTEFTSTSTRIGGNSFVLSVLVALEVGVTAILTRISRIKLLLNF